VPVPTVTVVARVSAVKGVGQMAGGLEAQRIGVNNKVHPLSSTFSRVYPCTTWAMPEHP